MSASLDQTLAAAQDLGKLVDQLIDLINGTKQQLTDALANANIPADVQAKIDAIFAEIDAQKIKLAAAVAAQTTTS